jgi:hypothetical protein
MTSSSLRLKQQCPRLRRVTASATIGGGALLIGQDELEFFRWFL